LRITHTFAIPFEISHPKPQRSLKHKRMSSYTFFVTGVAVIYYDGLETLCEFVLKGSHVVF